MNSDEPRLTRQEKIERQWEEYHQSRRQHKAEFEERCREQGEQLKYELMYEGEADAPPPPYTRGGNPVLRVANDPGKYEWLYWA